MRVETLQRPGKEAAGSRHEPGVVRQTAPADVDSVAPQTHNLMEEVLRRDNLIRALKQVQANKGAPGIDGMSVEALPEYLRKEWPTMREQLLKATYRPAPVRAVYLPKPGGGTRMLGMPMACAYCLSSPSGLGMIIVEAVCQSLVNRVQTVAPDRDASHLAALQSASIRVVLPSSFLKRHRLIPEVLFHPAQPRPEQPLVRPTLILVYKKYLLYKIKI